MTIQYFHFQINQASLVLLVGVIWYFSFNDQFIYPLITCILTIHYSV